MAIDHQVSFTSADPLSATGGIGSAVYSTTGQFDSDCTTANAGFLVICIFYPKQEVNGGNLSASISRGVGGETTALTSLGRLQVLSSTNPVPGSGGTWAEYFYLAATGSGGGDLTAGKSIKVTFVGFTFNNTSQNFLYTEALYTSVQGMRNMTVSKDAVDDWSNVVTTGDAQSWAHGVAINPSQSSTILGAGSGTTRRAITGTGTARKFALFDSGGQSGGATYTLNYDVDAADTSGSVAAELIFVDTNPFAFPAGNVVTFF